MMNSKTEAPISGTAHVLLVDDEIDVLSSVSRFLRLEGFEVSVATDMALAIKRLNTKVIDLVVTDYAMQGGNGVELCAFIRHYFPAIPVVLISGMATTATVVEAMQMGAVTFLEKPISPDELILQLNKILTKGALHSPLRSTVVVPSDHKKTLLTRVRAFEKFLIEQTLQAHGGRVQDAMKTLGLNRRTLNEKMNRLGIIRR